MKVTLKLVILALAIWFSYWLGIEFYYGAENIATIWLTNGLVWGLLLLLPYRHWAPVVAVAVAVQFVLNLEFSLSFALIITAINCLTPALGSLLLRKLCGGHFEFLNLRHVTLMILVVLIAEAVNSLVGATVVVWHYESAEFWPAFQIWWFSTAIGSLILLAVIVGWGQIASSWSITWRASRLIETAVLTLSAIIAGHFIFGSTSQEFMLVIEYPYIIIPILMWAVLRFPPVFPLTMLLFESLLLVYHAEYGRGPFITPGQSTHELVLAIQAFLVVTSATVLFICALIEERRKTVSMVQKSVEQVRLLLNSTAEAIYGLDMAGNCTFCNPACIRTLGYISENEFLGKNMHMLIHHMHPDGQHYQVEDCAIFQAFRTGENVHVDTEVFWKKDGTSFPAEYWSYPVLRDSKVVGAVVTFFDITERKWAEQDLLVSRQAAIHAQEQYEQVASMISDIVWRYEVDSEGQLLDSYISPVGDRILGLPEGTLNHSFDKYFAYTHPDDLPEIRQALTDTLVNKTQHVTVQYRIKKPDGSQAWLQSTGSAVASPNGGSVGFGTTTDITERKIAEKAIARQQALLEDTQRISMIGGFLWDVPAQTMTWTEELYRIHGYSREDLAGDPQNYISKSIECYIPSDRPIILEAFEQCVNEGKSYDMEFSFNAVDGTHKWIRTSAYSEKEDGVIVRVIGSVLDITESKLSAIALQESEAYIKAVMDNLPIGIAVNSVDPEISFEYMNDNFPKFYRTTREALADPNAFGTVVYEDPIFRKKIVSKILADCASGDLDRMHWEDVPITRKDKGTRFISARNTPVPNRNMMISTVWDVTDRKIGELERAKLEEQLRQTQKLEAIGTLAGGIAHDFNNILFAILGNADLAEAILPEDSPAKDNLREVVVAGKRAAELVKQILTFARKAEKKSVLLDVSTIAKEVTKLLRATLPTTIGIRLNLNTDKSGIKADPTEIHQVVMNLCTNAGQAMMEKGGTLEIGLDKTEVGESDIQKHPTLKPGSYLILSVGDTGPGIAPEIQERIFEPFFTTKETGQGTGMGLAVVHGIVKDLGGAINVYSEVGQGTTFRAYFPLTKESSSLEQSETSVLPRGNECVMVVDDEIVLARMISAMLESLGYVVETFSDSQQAVAAYLDAPERFDVIFTDQTMPNLTGAELAKKVLAQFPDQAIILSTGFSQTMQKEQATQIGISAFVSKPITKRDLAVAVRTVLD